MGAKPKMPGGGYGIPKEATGYYKPQAQSTDWLKAINQDWKAYEPQKVTTGYNVPSNVSTAYDPYQSDAIKKLIEQMQGYTPEQRKNVLTTPYSQYQQNALSVLVSMMQGTTPEGKRSIIEGAMAPVREEAARQRETTTGGAYARGLGQSGVLQRGLGQIDQSLLARLAEVTGNVEQSSTQNALNAVQAFQEGQLGQQRLGFDIEESSVKNVLNALQLFQSGQASQQQVQLALEKMKEENAFKNAELAQAYEELKTQTNLDERRLQLMLAELYQSAYKDDYTRSLEEQRIMQEYNISKAQLEQAKWVADQNAKQANMDWWGNLISNIIGSEATIVGGAL